MTGEAGAVAPCQAARPCAGQGMSDQAAIDAFAGDMTRLQADWGDLTAEERRDRMQAAVGARAQAAGFPAPKVVLADDLGGRHGELRFRTWDVAVNQDLAEKDTLSDEDAAKLGDTLAHETRHGEQWYLIARRDAAEGMDAAAIQRQRHLPNVIAQQAARQPLAADDSRRACADAMHRSVYGADAAARNRTIRGLKTHGDQVAEAKAAYEAAIARTREMAERANQANDAYKTLTTTQSADPADVAAALQSAQAAYADWQTAKGESDSALTHWQNSHAAQQQNYADYRALPEEADAWDVGGRTGAAMSGDGN